MSGSVPRLVDAGGRSRDAACLLRVGLGLPDLGHDLSRYPRHARDDAAAAHVRHSLDDCGCRAQRLSRRCAGSACPIDRRGEARRCSDSCLLAVGNGGCGLGRAVGAERPDRGDRRLVAVLDGGHRGAQERTANGLPFDLALGLASWIRGNRACWSGPTSAWQAHTAAGSWPVSCRSSSRAWAGRSDRPIHAGMRARPTCSARRRRR